MPKEQPNQNEPDPDRSSKNAKERHNSATLVALHGTEGSSGRLSWCSSEKDSGYSDHGSDWPQADVEDHEDNLKEYRGQVLIQRRTGQFHVPPETPVPLQAKGNLPSILIIQNMVLNQQNMTQNGSHPCRERDTPESGAPHLVMLQQPSVAPGLHVGPHHRKPLVQKASSTGGRLKCAFLPIFTSYPCIAPHPSKKPPNKTPPSQDSPNLNKRMCTEAKRDEVSATSSPVPLHPCKQPRATDVSSVPKTSIHSSNGKGHSSFSSSLASSSLSSFNTPSTLRLAAHSSPSSLQATGGLSRNRQSISCHRRRFLNTVEILRRSGLLNITLRTQELLRQSTASDRDIAQLQQHTQLLCQAASISNNSLEWTTAWQELHQAMVQSGTYPGLNSLQNKEISPGQNFARHTPITGNTCKTSLNEDREPFTVFTSMSDMNLRCAVPPQPEKDQENKTTGNSEEEGTVMAPDSSTG